MALAFAPLEGVLVPEGLQQGQQPGWARAMQDQEGAEPAMKAFGMAGSPMHLPQGLPEGQDGGPQGRREVAFQLDMGGLAVFPGPDDEGFPQGVQVLPPGG